MENKVVIEALITENRLLNVGRTEVLVFVCLLILHVCLVLLKFWSEIKGILESVISSAKHGFIISPQNLNKSLNSDDL